MTRIYVELLEEGSPTWRPTEAIDMGNSIFLVQSTEDYDPDDEVWAFPPGSIVVCVKEIKGGEELLIAKRLK